MFQPSTLNPGFTKSLLAAAIISSLFLTGCGGATTDLAADKTNDKIYDVSSVGATDLSGTELKPATDVDLKTVLSEGIAYAWIYIGQTSLTGYLDKMTWENDQITFQNWSLNNNQWQLDTSTENTSTSSVNYNHWHYNSDTDSWVSTVVNPNDGDNPADWKVSINNNVGTYDSGRWQGNYIYISNTMDLTSKDIQAQLIDLGVLEGNYETQFFGGKAFTTGAKAYELVYQNAKQRIEFNESYAISYTDESGNEVFYKTLDEALLNERESIAKTDWESTQDGISLYEVVEIDGNLDQIDYRAKLVNFTSGDVQGTLKLVVDYCPETITCDKTSTSWKIETIGGKKVFTTADLTGYTMAVVEHNNKIYDGLLLPKEDVNVDVEFNQTAVDDIINNTNTPIPAKSAFD